MKEKALRRLSRAELLELLLEQTKEAESLREQLKEAQEALRSRQLKMQKAGDLAHAVLAVNEVVEAAQNAAQQYLESIVAMEAETKEKCEMLIRQAKEEAARIREGKTQDAPLESPDTNQE